MRGVVLTVVKVTRDLLLLHATNLFIIVQPWRVIIMLSTSVKTVNVKLFPLIAFRLISYIRSSNSRLRPCFGYKNS